jgi:glycosyltransferase involved in cell wall biosynthesis
MIEQTQTSLISTPLISIVLIFLNAKRATFFEDAIESVFTQTYQNWELLLVDDGSTDESTTIARKYAQDCPEKIRYLEHAGHQNQGMSASRNLGIQSAKGEYIAFLDADDLYLPHKLEQQLVMMIEQPNAAFVCGCTEWWYSWSGNLEDSHKDVLQQYGLPLNTLVSPPTLLSLFLQNGWASPCDILVRREIVEAVGGYESRFRGLYEDQAFHAKICLRYPVFVSSECWYRYRQHPSSCTAFHHKSGDNHPRQVFLEWLEQYAREQGFVGSIVWKAIRKELRPFRSVSTQLMIRIRIVGGRWRLLLMSKIQQTWKQMWNVSSKLS